ncbi:MAG: beta-propeller fold lactonase family protein, partial [Bacteroidota bacterium]
HVYAISFDSEAVNIFSRNIDDGTLTYIGAIANGTNGVTAMTGAYMAFVSPDGQNVYVAGTEDGAITVFTRNAATGQLGYLETQEDDVDGVDGLFGIATIEMSPEGDYLYALGAYEDAISIFQRNAGTGALTYVTKVENGSGSVTNMSYPIELSISEDGDNVYVTSFNDNSLIIFERNSSTGTLLFVDAETASNTGTQGIGGAVAVAMSNDGNHLYIAGETDNSLAVFNRDASTGEIDFIEAQQNNTDGVLGLRNIRDVAVSPDDKFVYTVGYWDHSITIFQRNTSTGELTYVDRFRDNSSVGLNGASSINVSPDGEHVYVTGFWENSISTFSRNETTGLLTNQQQLRDGIAGMDGLTWANGSVISPDGKTVYVTSAFDNAVSVFGIDENTGLLTFLEFHKDGVGGVNGMQGAEDVVVSPDNKFVYVAGDAENAIAMFSRNSTDGRLSYLGLRQNGVDGIGGLGGVKNLFIDPAGKHLYASGEDESALVVFSIDQTTGMLTFEKSQTDNLNLVNGLGGAQGIVVSNDNRYIYVSAANDDAVSIFSCTYDVNMTESICQGDSILIGANTYKETGVYLDTFKLDGCWTLIDLDLTVLPTETNIDAEICQGESYTFNGQTYDAAGVYSANFNSSLGCDSIVNLNLQIVSSYTGSTFEQQICQGDSYEFGGVSYSESGDYSNTFSSRGGCDSTVTLQLTVNPSYDEFLDIRICSGDFYVFNEKNYVEGGIYTASYTSSTGCDSTVTLKLTVLNPNGPNLLEASICQGESYELGGSAYDQAGSYTTSVTTASGCVSNVTLNLTVNDSYEQTISQTICEGSTIEFGDQTLTSAGTYKHTYNTVTGCDSTVTLNLSFATNSTSLSAIICEGQTYNLGGVLYSNTGIFEATFPSSLGCGDSTVTLNLTVEEDSREETISVCFGESYELGGTVYDQTGTFIEQLTTTNGCPLEVTLYLTVHDDLTATETITDDKGNSEGAIQLLISGGVAPFGYEWSNGATTRDISGLPAGTYTVTVTDDIDCQETFTFEVRLSSGIDFLDDALLIDLMPNPVNNGQNIYLQIESPDSRLLNLEIYTTTGILLQSEKLQVGLAPMRHAIESPSQSGLYLLRITDEQGAQRSLKFSVQ